MLLEEEEEEEEEQLVTSFIAKSVYNYNVCTSQRSRD